MEVKEDIQQENNEEEKKKDQIKIATNKKGRKILHNETEPKTNTNQNDVTRMPIMKKRIFKWCNINKIAWIAIMNIMNTMNTINIV